MPYRDDNFAADCQLEARFVDSARERRAERRRRKEEWEIRKRRLALQCCCVIDGFVFLLTICSILGTYVYYLRRVLLLLCVLAVGCSGLRLSTPPNSRTVVTPECQHKADVAFRLSVAAAVFGGCGTASGALGGVLKSYPRAVLGMEISGATCAATGGVLGLLSTYYASSYSKCSK
jgi:hypothetical protein